MQHIWQARALNIPAPIRRLKYLLVGTMLIVRQLQLLSLCSRNYQDHKNWDFLLIKFIRRGLFNISP